MDLKIPLGIAVLLVAGPPAISANALVMNCEIDGVFGPDGQPSTMRWRINLENRTVCLLPECVLKAYITVVTPKIIVFTIQGDPKLEQRIEIDRVTSTFLWTALPRGRESSGRCYGEPAAGG